MKVYVRRGDVLEFVRVATSMRRLKEERLHGYLPICATMWKRMGGHVPKPGEVIACEVTVRRLQATGKPKSHLGTEMKARRARWRKDKRRKP